MNQEAHLVPFDPFKMMDLLDDEAIVAEIEGRISDKWVYHFPAGQGEKEIWGISKDGTDQACIMLGQQGHIIREGEVKYQQCPIDPECVNFTAQVSLIAVSRDGVEVSLDRVTGAKRQWTKQALRSGAIKNDPFWFEKGMMKAIRNARQRLIPEEIKAKIIALAKEKGKVKTIDSSDANQPAKSAKPKTGEFDRPAWFRSVEPLLTETGLTHEHVHGLYNVASMTDMTPVQCQHLLTALKDNPQRLFDKLAEKAQPAGQGTLPGAEG
mgnify:CR=1 FL=1